MYKPPREKSSLRRREAKIASGAVAPGQKSRSAPEQNGPLCDRFRACVAGRTQQDGDPEMSLMKTFARVAAGVVLAKGLSSAMKSRSSQQGGAQSGSGGGLLGDLLGGAGSGGSLQDRLGQVLGGRSGGGAKTGGLGGLLDGLTGSGGGLGGLLGGLLGGGAAATGAAGGLAAKDSQPSNDASFGELFNDAITRNDEPQVAPTPEQNVIAGLMLKAMIQAAKADGRIDDEERRKLLSHLGDDLDDEERAFIREQMAAPVDPEALARDVPRGMESQVYLVSLLAIDLDNEQEARYLHALAQAMGLSREAVNDIHEKAGAIKLYG